MKKIIIIIISIILIISLVIGISMFNKKDEKKLDPEIIKNQENKIDSIGTTKDGKIVIKLLDAPYETYYVFIVKNNTYEQYSYRFYKSQTSYEKAVENYSSGIYQLEKDSKALMTKIFIQKGNKVGDQNLYNVILDKYSDTSKYEIIEE